jgi:hypothetical protein
MTRIEKDKVLRLTPFDACGSILGGEYTCAVIVGCQVPTVVSV